MAGFGRTGEWFSVDHWQVVPDLLTMAKGLTSAYVQLGAVGMRRHIAEHFEKNVFYLKSEIRNLRSESNRFLNADLWPLISVFLVPAAGVEPATFRSGGERSNPLSYAGLNKIAGFKEMNQECPPFCPHFCTRFYTPRQYWAAFGSGTWIGVDLFVDAVGCSNNRTLTCSSPQTQRANFAQCSKSNHGFP